MTSETLQELTGSEEASMTFFAVRRWYGWGAGPVLNLDIGGGSFEMAFGQDELPEVATSVPLGASRLTRDWLAEDPPSAKSVKELRRYIRATLAPAVKQFEGLGRLPVSDGFRLGEGALGLGHPGPGGRAAALGAQVVP